MTSTSEAVLDIAGMGAELPMAISVDSELLPTSRACIGVICLSFYQVQMAIPPLVSAGIRAESFSLPARVLRDWFPAFLTNGALLWCGEAIPPAERLHGIDGNPKFCCYAAIPCPIPAQGYNLLSLFFVHDRHLLKFGLQE